VERPIEEALDIELRLAPVRSFANWPDADVPRTSAGVYTVWLDGNVFAYVGYAGRSISAASSGQSGGLYQRLHAHASGRRSGDQFCVYVSDRLVVPSLSPSECRAIGVGELRMDHLTRQAIRGRMAYRFATVQDGATARRVELVLREGRWAAGKPFLNPLG
jgi:hypothetical protein